MIKLADDRTIGGTSGSGSGSGSDASSSMASGSGSETATDGGAGGAGGASGTASNGDGAGGSGSATATATGSDASGAGSGGSASMTMTNGASGTVSNPFMSVFPHMFLMLTMSIGQPVGFWYERLSQHDWLWCLRFRCLLDHDDHHWHWRFRLCLRDWLWLWLREQQRLWFWFWLGDRWFWLRCSLQQRGWCSPHGHRGQRRRRCHGPGRHARAIKISRLKDCTMWFMDYDGLIV